MSPGCGVFFRLAAPPDHAQLPSPPDEALAAVVCTTDTDRGGPVSVVYAITGGLAFGQRRAFESVKSSACQSYTLRAHPTCSLARAVPGKSRQVGYRPLMPAGALVDAVTDPDLADEVTGFVGNRIDVVLQVT
jgi:hypothetical protein